MGDPPRIALSPSRKRPRRTMSRTRLILAALTAGALLVAVPASLASSSATTLTGVVGPGFTITLKQGAKKVTALKAGKYTLKVQDKSNLHDFRIKGPGLNKVVTSVSFIGSKTISITLKKGTYTFVCDPHAAIMKGSFKA
jgi:plastocyanin